MYLTESDRQNAVLKKNLKLLQGGRSAGEMALIIGAKSENTWYSRLRRPDTLTIRELKMLCEECGSTPAKVVSGSILL